MTGKRGDDGRVCLCDRPDGTCAGLAVRRLSRERVSALAEEIWTASSGTLPPAPSTSDPRSSRAGASAQAAFARRREQERRAWRPGAAWQTYAVIGASGVGAVLVGQTVGAWLGGPIALLLAVWIGWRLRFRPSAAASVWKRQAAVQRRTAATLTALTDEGYLVLHDVVLPGWLDSLDHVVVGRTGVWVLTSWRRRRLPLAGAAGPTGTLRGLLARRDALAEVLDGWARVQVRPLLCLHGRWSASASRRFFPIQVATPRHLADLVRSASMAAPGQVELASARLLEVLRPAA